MKNENDFGSNFNLNKAQDDLNILYMITIDYNMIGLTMRWQ